MASAEKKLVQPADTSFAAVVKFLEGMSRATCKKQRDTYLHRLVTHGQMLDRTSDDCFAIIRLILPFVSLLSLTDDMQVLTILAVNLSLVLAITYTVLCLAMSFRQGANKNGCRGIARGCMASRSRR